MAKNRQNFILYLLLSTSISIIIIVISFFQFYENIELKLLDARFRIRGPIPIRADIGTIDIDVRALQEEGRFQDWTRDKHERIIRFGHEHGVRMLAFDIYFPEPSVPHILASDLELLPEQDISSESVQALIRDYDRTMREAMVEAGNVYLAESFKPLDESETVVKKRSPLQEEALELSKRFYQEAPDLRSTSLYLFYDIEPPIKDLITAAKGVAYAQAVADGDGVIRRYPLVGVYDGRLFPSIALLMACDYFGVPFKNVSVIPGEHVIIPLGVDIAGRDQVIRIPISSEGYMMVNWAGDWEDDFRHYPYSLVKGLYENEHPNYILSEIKTLIHEEPDLIGDVRTFQHRVISLGLEPVEIVQDAFSKVLLAYQVESFVMQDFQKGPEAFFKSQGIPFEKVPPGMIEFFLEIKDNVAIERGLLEHPELSYDMVSVQLDLNDSPKQKRNFIIIKNLLKTEGTVETQHPLYFYPSQSEFTLKGRAIVPFEFHNKMLFYGLTAAGTHDLNPMPFSPRYPMVGLHANVLNTILSQIFIQRAPKVFEIIIMLGIGIILGLLIPRFHPVLGAGLSLGLWGVFGVANFFSFTMMGMWVDMIGPSLIFLIGYISITVYNYITQEKDKKFLHETFKTYLSPELIDKMYEQRQIPQLGGEEGIRTALFTDIQSFSSIAEKLGNPTTLVELLNEYLTAMTDILLDHQGTLDKYEGDAILAFFGAPMPQEDHAEKACHTGLVMQKKLGELREKWKSEGDKWPQIVTDMLMRIGINSGPIVTGNMGSATRMNYTMMGDAVNLAARLESIAKQYGVFTLCSGETLNLVGENTFETRLIDRVRVVGKTEPVSMYELLGKQGELDSKYIQLQDIFNEAQEFYFKGDWNRALKFFKKSIPLEPYGNHVFVKTTPSSVFVNRCENYLISSPGDDWDGVYTATSK